MKIHLLTIALLQYTCTCEAIMGSFITQPTNTTVEVGKGEIIPCKLSREIKSNRNWYINGFFTVENNLPIGIYAVENGLYIAGDYIKHYNQTGFRCSYSVNTGPPNYFKTFKSTLGVLTVDASNNGTINSTAVTTVPPKKDALQAVASAAPGSIADEKMIRIITWISITVAMLVLI